MVYLFTVIGLMLVVEGVPWFLSPSTVKKILRQVLVLPESTLRLFGALLMFAGVLTVYLTVR